MSFGPLTIFLLFNLSLFNPSFPHSSNDEKIVGKWISTEKNVIVKVYKEGDEFKAKVVWFNDADDLSRPMKTRCDIHNPDKELRSKRILGMDVLENLKYNPETNRWEDGVIYDANSGRHWSSVVYFNNDGLLEVKGYWKFEFICKTILFRRVS
jgi:uncharacterized protein (DUF2147 family)